MDQGPLVADQIDAGAKFLAEFQRRVPVRAAFWLKDSENGAWSLYVASDRITDENIDVAYGEVLPIDKQLGDPWFDPFQVKLIGSKALLARAVLEINRRQSGRIPPRFHGQALGGVGVEELYIYPLPLPVHVP